MKFIQYYLECLSHASYLIGDETTGRAVVVDPQRDISGYLADAEANGMAIELVLETHFHADFLSGHLELAEATGAEIGFGSVAEGKAEFPIRAFADGERYSLGEVTLEVRHTPGHTPESVSIVVWERPDDPEPYGVLTGDTLFIGDVGRPDLLGSLGMKAEDLAADLFDSLHAKLMTLPDATRVYPSHGAGSACGKNLSTSTWSTLGEQKESNYALKIGDKQTFVDLVTEGQPPAPAYFVYDAIRNRKPREVLDDTEKPAALTIDEVLARQATGAVVVDTRDPADFATGHLRGAINVGLSGRFAEYTGSVVSPEDDLILFSEEGTELEAKVRLARIGFDRVVGYLPEPEAALVARPELSEVGSRLTARETVERRRDVPGLQLVDVRNLGEVAANGEVSGSVNVPLAQLTGRVGELDPARPTVVFCAGGYRSSIAASVLRRAGFADVSDMLGGFTAWRETVQPA